MKIIAGERKGHSLRSPHGHQTRPTLARVRESLFAIIAGDIPGSIFCDLFAGVGAIGLEALSRGALKAYLVESNREPLECLKANVEKLRYDKQANVIAADALKWSIPADETAPDIIFADPPYKTETIDRLVERLIQSQLKQNTLIILQTPAGYTPCSSPELKFLRKEKYGASALHFYLKIEKKSIRQ